MPYVLDKLDHMDECEPHGHNIVMDRPNYYMKLKWTIWWNLAH
jgi:hypothetical protein